MRELIGTALTDFEDPIRVSLSRYAEIGDGSIEFDLDGACRLELTPDKPNSARSATTVKYLGEAASTLYVIAFAPQDGTGDESVYRLADTNTRDYAHNIEYPNGPQVIPRKKTGMASEAHVTLLSRHLEDPNGEPVLFAGNLDLITRDYILATLRKEAELGQDAETYTAAMAGEHPVGPTTTLTTGYRGAINGTGDPNLWNYWRQRFGDPHAVFNGQDTIQICGFIGIPAANAKLEDLAPLRALRAIEPVSI